MLYPGQNTSDHIYIYSREFQKDQDEESNAPTSPASPSQSLSMPVHSLLPQLVPADPNHTKSPSNPISPSHSRRRSSLRGAGHRRRSSIANTDLLVESMATNLASPLIATYTPTMTIKNNNNTNNNATDDSALINLSMDLADTSNITTAFKSHFTFPPSPSPSVESHQVAAVAEVEVEGAREEVSFATSDSMDIAEEGDDVTKAFAVNTHLFGSSIPNNATTSSPGASPQQQQQQQQQRLPILSPRSPRTQRDKDFDVPLGSAGVDEATVERLRLQKAKRGSQAFYNVPTNPEVKYQFAVHHASSPFSRIPGKIVRIRQEEDNAKSDASSLEEETRRSSNVFEKAFGAKTIKQVLPQESQGVLTSSQDLYPSLEGLGQDKLDMTAQNVTQGQAALAFLDSQEEEEEEGDDIDLLTPPLEQHPSQPIIVQSQDIQGEEQEEQYYPLPDPVFVPRTSRLSVVPESQLEGDEQDEEDEEDDDMTRDMDETAVYGSIIQQAQQRRLSIAHPTPHSTTPSDAVTATATRRLSAVPSPSPSSAKLRLPPPCPVKRSTPIKLGNIRRLSAITTAENAKDSNAATIDAAEEKGLSKSVPASLATRSPARTPRRILSPLKSTCTTNATGLTPAMNRLSPWNPRLVPAVSSPVHPVSQQHVRPIPATPVNLAPAPSSEPFFDESAPMEAQVHSHADADIDDEEHPAQLTLDQFLHLTSVQFMDDMGPSTAARRKSLMSASTRMHPSEGSSLDAMEDGGKVMEVTLADQVQASAAILPFMDMYRMVSATFLKEKIREI